MAEKTGKRKIDHIKICLGKQAQAKDATTGFEDIQLVHRALPEVNKENVDLTTKFLGKKLSAPIIVGAMTGGTDELIEIDGNTVNVAAINGNIAQAVEKLGLGMGLGSQRAALEDQKLEKTYRVAREKAPHALLIANIGGVQLVHGYGLKEVKRIAEMIDADAVAVHLNALQEAVQPEGQTNFKGVLAKIAEIAGSLDVPVIVKETGAGIAAEDARALENAGVKAIDIGGVGGTSFAAVEYQRASPKKEASQYQSGDALRDWGIPTAISLIESAQTTNLPLIASGGLRSGTDIVKALALNASLVSISQPILETAVKGVRETEDKLRCLMEESRNVMFLTGVEKVDDLPNTPVVITGKTAEWLQARGFNLQKYAKRGAR